MREEVENAKRWYAQARTVMDAIGRDVVHPLKPEVDEFGTVRFSLWRQTSDAAFACELYLKTLLALEGCAVKETHSLIDLFSLLPENVRMSLSAQTVNKGFVEKGLLGAILTECRDSYVSCRYAQVSTNPPGAHWAFLRRFSFMLGEYVSKRIVKVEHQAGK